MLRLNRYHFTFVLLLAGLFVIGFAFASLNLFQMSMANLRFLRQFGWVVVMESGLIQLAEIIACAIAALLCCIGFKLCEAELV
ncbi:hypothetical protein [Yoonia sp. R2-816]|uniref:hypothetical protein n=1 Tax=Yoonia sp. R2-816 TaxID=3342638 RepID=UPI0037272001